MQRIRNGFGPTPCWALQIRTQEDAIVFVLNHQQNHGLVRVGDSACRAKTAARIARANESTTIRLPADWLREEWAPEQRWHLDPDADTYYAIAVSDDKAARALATHLDRLPQRCTASLRAGYEGSVLASWLEQLSTQLDTWQPYVAWNAIKLRTFIDIRLSNWGTAMFRIVGFIVGCGASAGLLLLLMGTPDFHLGDQPADATRYDRAIDKLREKRWLEPNDGPLEANAPPPDTATAADEGTREEPPDHTLGDETLLVAGAADAAREATLETEQPAPAVEPAAEIPESPPALPLEPEWHAFWNPFRSEVAATGFVRRLENVTGLDYRIAKVKTGVYEVAFSYQGDDELSANLAQISAATGLDLSETLR